MIEIALTSIIAALVWHQYRAANIISQLGRELAPRYMTRDEYYQWIYKHNDRWDNSPVVLIRTGRSNIVIDDLNKLIACEATPVLYDTVFHNLF